MLQGNTTNEATTAPSTPEPRSFGDSNKQLPPVQNLIRAIIQSTATNPSKASKQSLSDALELDNHQSPDLPEADKRKPRRPDQNDDRFGALLRCAVKALSGYSGLSIADIEKYLGNQIGISEVSFPRYYKGQGRIDARAIKIFLAFGTQCTFLSREWGRALLEAGHYGRYGDPAELLDAVAHWSVDALPVRPPRIHSNLPGPSYPRFVMRQNVYQELVDGLNARTALVTLVGLPGAGKTTLALEMATQCLGRTRPADTLADLPACDAVVWISDKDTPGKTRLRSVLETITNTLDYPELGRFEIGQLRCEVDQILRGRRVLLVIDNLETITDPALIEWLQQLPEPSKALVTSRVYPTEFENRGPIKVDLGRMSEVEGQAFIALYSAVQRLPITLDAAAQQQLLSVTGGNPLAVQMLLGLLRVSGQSVAKVLELSRATPSRDISTLIGASWELLIDLDRQVLLALTLFTPSAEDAALQAVAGLAEMAYLDVIERLSNLALIETTAGADGDGATTLRRALHPLVRQHAEARLSDDGMFAAAARARRMAWALAYAERYGGHRPNEADALRRIEAEQENLWATLTWSATHGYDRETIALAHKLEYFYYTRAQWRRNRELYGHLIDAARRLNDPAEKVNALALQIQLLSRQGQPEQAQEELAELVDLSRRETLHGESFFRAQHAQALAHMARGSLVAAATAWQQIIDQSAERGVSDRLITGTLHWLALCRQRQGEPSAARALMQQSLARALAQDNPRRAARNQIALASFALDAGQPEEAQRQLEAASALDAQPDQEQRAHYLHALGRLHAARGDLPSARAALGEVLSLFERMGMAGEIREARERMMGLG